VSSCSSRFCGKADQTGRRSQVVDLATHASMPAPLAARHDVWSPARRRTCEPAHRARGCALRCGARIHQKWAVSVDAALRIRLALVRNISGSNSGRCCHAPVDSISACSRTSSIREASDRSTPDRRQQCQLVGCAGHHGTLLRCVKSCPPTSIITVSGLLPFRRRSLRVIGLIGYAPVHH